jgi:predicted exporter
MKFEFRDEADGLVSGKIDTQHVQDVRRLEFDLPNKLLAQLVGAGAGYLAVMYIVFRAGEGLGLIFAVFGLVLVAYFGLPWLMQRQSGRKADDPPRRGAWGIDTASGYLSGRAAWAQVMTVPTLMLLWAVVIGFIR